MARQVGRSVAIGATAREEHHGPPPRPPLHLGASAPALAAPPQRERLIDTIRQAPDPTPGQVRDGNPFPGIIVSSDQSTPLGCSDPIFGTWGTYIYCQNSIVSSGVYIGVRTDYYLWAQGGWIWFYGFHCYPNGECHEV